MKRNIRLRSAHIPGIDNVMADFQSHLNPKLEWTTPASWFNLAVQEFGMLVDIFASPRTKQSKYYMVWKGKKKGFCLGDGLLNAWHKRVCGATNQTSQSDTEIVNQMASGNRSNHHSGLASSTMVSGSSS